MNRSKSFLPIIDKETKILILGSLPGKKSLELREYYGHPRNRLWYTDSGTEEDDISNDNFRVYIW